MSLTKIVVAAAACLLFLSGSLALADRPVPPRSYTTFSANKEFEFVMNAPDGGWRDKRESGLYRRNSTTPLWTIPWYADRVTVSSDGVHLIRHGPWPFWIEYEGYSFFANGKLLREYRAKEFLSSIEGVRFVSTSTIAWLEREHFDDAKGLLTITTLSGDEHVISVVTGQMVHSGKTAERLLKAEICAFRVASHANSTACRSLFPELTVLSLAPCHDYISANTWLQAVCHRQSLR